METRQTDPQLAENNPGEKFTPLFCKKVHTGKLLRFFQKSTHTFLLRFLTKKYTLFFTPIFVEKVHTLFSQKVHTRKLLRFFVKKYTRRIPGFEMTPLI